MRCDQLLLWCKQYERPVEAAAAPATAAPLELDGMVMLKKKDTDNDDVFTTSRSKGTCLAPSVHAEELCKRALANITDE